MSSVMKFGLTQQFPCSYLPDKEEQLLVFVDDAGISHSHYDVLINSGFRRSGDQIYRPHCEQCDACQSLRIPVHQFTPSRSQKRILNKNSDIQTLVQSQPSDEYYALYENYVNTRHRDGSMYPATPQQYSSFVSCQWQQPLFLELRHENKLVGVAVTDQVELAMSALYTFFDPEFESRSIGTFAILKQIELCKQRNLRYLYLGYQVEGCAKMDYKRRFLPHERFFDNKWHHFSKNTP